MRSGGDVEQAAPEGRRGPTPGGTVGYAMALLALFALPLLAGAVLTPGAFHGDYYDPDSYTRLLRVRDVLTGGAWLDPVLERANTPYGLRLHWTRPMDVALLAVAFPTRIFVGVDRSVELAAAIVPPLLLALIGICGAWGARALRRDTPVLLAGLIIALQPAVLTYGMPGHADHHELFLLAFVLGTAAFLRAVSADRSAGYVLAGISAGLGLWISVESLLFLSLGVVVLGVAWIRTGAERWRRGSVLYSVTAGLVSISALLVERPPTDWGSTELDRLSLPYVLIPTLAGLFWLVAPRLDRMWGRAASAVFGVVAAAAAVLLLNGGFFQGPFADVDPAVWSLWLRNVPELQPILLPSTPEGAVRFVAFLALPVLTWGTLGRGMVHRWGGRGAALLVVGLLYTVLALWESRWAPYAESVAGLVLAAHVPALYAASERWRPRSLAVAARASLVAGLVVLFPVVAAGAGAVMQQPYSGGEAGSCDPVRAVAALPPQPVLDILAHVRHGPRLLYHTPHRVLASPYHRAPGVLEAYRIMTSRTESEGLEDLEARGIDLIVLCPASDADLFHRTVDGETTLFGRAIEGDLPRWLQRVPSPAGSDALVLRVVPE